MIRKNILLLMVGLFLSTMLFSAFPARAQDSPDGVIAYQLNMGSGPGTDYAVLTTLPPETGMIFEARNEDMSWLLGHTVDGMRRGWVASLYLNYRDGFTAARLPLSCEEITVVPASSESVSVLSNDLISGSVPELEAVPIVPQLSDRVREIYLLGQQLGNDPRMITRVGECNSMSYAFLMPFGRGQYDLGPYGYLQSVVDFFPVDAWTHESLATRAGLSSIMAIDPAMADPGVCGGKSWLECECDRAKPSVAFIMLGLQDVYFLTPDQYQQAMRRAIDISIDYGVIPILTTFPVLPGDYGVRDQNRIAFNTIIVDLAHEYNVPVMNVWLATQGVENHGIGEDFVHLSQRGDNWVSFSGDEQQWGFTMWNLVALQTLAQMQSVMN